MIVLSVTLGHAIGDGLPETCVLAGETAKKAGKQGQLSNNNIEEVASLSTNAIYVTFLVVEDTWG